MYLAIDIGGTKTFVASLTNDGVIQERLRFPTPKKYADFIRILTENVDSLTTKEFIACGIGFPGRVDRAHGVGVAMGNLPWLDVNLKIDAQKIARCPVAIDNDANLAGLSEAMLLKHQFNRVLYVTISTGIGTGIIINQAIDPDFANSEGGQIIVEHAGKLETWEKLVSGKAIVRRFGKQARDITDPKTWRQIAHDISLGLIDLIAVVQPQVIVLGGGVDDYFTRFESLLMQELKRYETPLVPLPIVVAAARPDDAVLYGCFDLAKATYGKARS